MSAAANPWMKFYPSDWAADQSLRVCSLAARGLWIECMCIMHRSKDYGYLVLNGSPVTDAQLAALAGTSPAQIAELLAELKVAGVFSVTSKNVIYSRRMTRDDKKSKIASKNGKTGGNPSLCKTTEIQPLDNPPDKPGDKPKKLEARDHKEREEEDANASSKKADDLPPDPVLTPDPPPPPELPKPSARGTRFSLTAMPSDWFDFAVGEGHPDPEEEWKRFTDYWRGVSGAKGVKADWFATWRNWVRRAKNDGQRGGRTGRKSEPTYAERIADNRRAVLEVVGGVEGRGGAPF